MKKLLMVSVLSFAVTFSGCLALDRAIGVDGKDGPVTGFVRGIESATSGTPVGGIAALLLGAFGVYQKVRARKYAEGLEGVVVGIDRALDQGVKLSVEKQELYNKIRGGIQEVVGDVAFVEKLIAEIKAKARA